MSAHSSKSSRQHPHGQKGQGLVEYALILVLVAIVSIVILALLGPAVGNVFSNVIANLGGSTVPVAAAAASNPTAAPAPTTAPTSVPAIVTGAAARAQYCADRPGWVGGVNWGSATHTFTDDGLTYQVTGAWNCPYP